MPGKGHAIKTKPRGSIRTRAKREKVLVSADFGADTIDHRRFFLVEPEGEIAGVLGSARSRLAVSRAPLQATMTVAASSKIELALCFEDVAKNIFKSPDGTMSGCVRASTPSDDRNGSPLFVSRADSTPRPRAFPFHRNRPQLAAVLAADTGLGLAPWELKLFLKELDLGDDDRVSADRFCGIYTFLASRPPTPAAAPAAAPASEPAEAAAAAPAAPDPAQMDPVSASVPAAPRDETAEPPSAPPSSSSIAISAQIGLPFPPEFVLDPTGRVPTEKAQWRRESDNSDGSASVGSRWRSADGAGQCASFPFLGAARAPQSRAVRSAKASDVSRRLPNSHALASLHAVGVFEEKANFFASHPNEISGVFHAFHQLLRFELGIHNEVNDKGAGWWRCDKSAFLDLQSVYGADETETEAVRVHDATDVSKTGSIDVDAVVRRAAIATRLSSDLGGKGSATAAQALLTMFARNHNELAKRVASAATDSPIDADVVFQTARHANCAAFRAVVLKDYLPFMKTGQHLGDVPGTIAEESTNETRLYGACVSVELDLLMRAVASVAPREDVLIENGSENLSHVAEALAGASGRRCGLGARRSLPKRMVPSETAAVRRARAAGACTLNEFRLAHGLPRWANFDEMTAGEEVLSKTLSDLYGGDVDDVELYTGFLCEANVVDPGACLTATARETVGKMIGALVSGDAFFRESFLGNDDMSVASFAAGADLGKDATLAGLLEKHAGVTVTGVSAFEVGALAIAKTEEEGDGSA